MTREILKDIPVEYTNDPFLDDRGYPSEAELERIRKWPIAMNRDIRNLLAYVQIRWMYARNFEYIPLGDQEFTISTGGWSGNESLIAALEDNEIFWSMCWQATRRGGHYTFQIQSEAPNAQDADP